jgi:TonB family protein
MSSEERVKAEPCASAFSGCLVDGDAATTARERKIKRRAIVISVVLQTMGLGALVIAPLLARPAELTERVVTPVPPYSHHAASRVRTETNIERPTTAHCVYCVRDIQPIARTHDGPAPTGYPNFMIDIPGSGPSTGPLNLIDPRAQPTPPDQPPQKRRIHESSIDPAMLTRRVEPIYPSIPKQLHRSGKVELRAIIGIDGGIQSLEVVSGDPLFVDSALQAVRQWHYKPTYLNNQAVEIDTYITVIYTLQQ